METTKKEMKAYLLHLQQMQKKCFGMANMDVIVGNLSSGEFTLTAWCHVYDASHDEILHSTNIDVDEWRSHEDNDGEIKKLEDFIDTYVKKL